MNNVSLSGKKWFNRNYDSEYINFVKDNYSLDEITAKLLSIRKISRDKIQSYLKPSIKNLIPNPNIIKDMQKSVERVSNSIVKGQKIGIFGDYDVDGASSTALLGNYLKKIKKQFEIYIPDRKTEGYGPSVESFDKLIKLRVNLIITVDCGTMSFEAIEHAQKKNIDVIVIDHHQSELNLPNAYSIINPNRFDDNSNLNYLCAAGVCFMFLVSLNTKLRQKKWFEENGIQEPNLLDFLDLVSLGTICDVVPLTGLNRAIVKQGLKIINKKKNLGLKTLIDICNIDNKASTYHLGYVLGPRINAGGRVGKCSHGAHLLLNNDPKESFKLASELNQFNDERKNIEKNLLNIVLNKVSDKINDPVIVLEGDNWHEGIIGIIASRIKDKFNKPTIIISVNGKLGKASARSVLGFDIGAVILSAVQSKLLIKGGGHKMAGGFSIKDDKIEIFKKFVNKRYKSIFKEEKKKNYLFYDSQIAPSAINLNFYDKVEMLSPFGSGNPEPKFLLEEMKVVNSKIVGEKHIKSVLGGMDGTIIKSISFNTVDSDLGQFLLNNKGNKFNIIGKLSLNEWKGEKNVEFIIDDISVITKQKN